MLPLVLTCLLLLGLVPAATAAQPEPAETKSFDRIPLSGIDARLMPAMADPTRVLTVMVQMEGAPVAVREARVEQRGQTLSRSTERAIRQNLQAQQNRIKDDIEALGGDVVSTVQDAYNGIKVQVAAKHLSRLADLPGARAVRDLQTFEPTNATSVPFIGAPQVWENLGLTGKNVKVGVIDTGIDYTHADFGGPGTVEAYESNDPEAIEGDTFPTAKVAGGYDFVGNSYDASSENPTVNTPQPDPDPLDCNGHGSHVSGTTAGLGVLADGSTFTGPYDPSTYENDFNVGPGVAPEATLYALKVFGCEGSTDVTVEAIDWAVEHDLDVINMSLGSPAGRSDDPTAVATNNAAKAGVIVVASAGNSGAANYLTGSPGSATRAISVAAMNSIETLDVADVTIEGQGTETLQNSNGADVSEPIAGTIRVLQDDPATDINEALGCQESDYDIVAPGDILVTFRGICPRIDRAILGQAAGAVAVVFINNEEGPPPVEGLIPDVDIPFLGATPEQADFFTQGDGEQGTITDGGVIDNPEFRTLAGFTSNGPRNGDSFPKPDLTAPGVSINSAFVGSGNQGFRLSGTSMASPHVAGVAALHRQARPDWSVEEAKAAIVNTANPGDIVGYSTVRAGSGLVDPADAVRTPVVATTEPGSASAAFGYIQFDDPISRSRTITLHNKSDEQVTYTTSVDADTDAGGAAQVQVEPSRVTVPANGSATVRLRLHVDPVAQPPAFQTVSGTVLVEPIVPVFLGSDASDLRVPYLAVPDPTSAVQTRPLKVNLKDGQESVDFRTRNRSDVTGTADVYALGMRDPNEDSPTTDVRAVGVQAFPAAGEDPAIGFFAFNTHSRVSNPAVNEWDVLIDTDEDGTDDYAVIGFDLGPILGAFDGRLGSFTVDLSTGEIIVAFFAAGGLNTSHVLLPFLPDTLGVDMENADFTYVAGVFSLEGFPDDIVDGRSAFNVIDQPVETGQFFILGGGERIEWSAGVDQEQLAETPVLGYMIVNANNHSGPPQADLVRLRR